MAIKGTVKTKFGEEREVYIRINNIDNVQNHKDGTSMTVRLRAFLKEFTGTEPYVWDSEEENLNLRYVIDITKPIWEQVYSAVKVDPTFTTVVTNITNV